MVLRPQSIGPGLEGFAVRTPTLPPATHTNSYALGEREVLLVEPSPSDEDERRAWVEWVRGLASSGRTPVAIVATHHHRDHVGGAAWLARETGLPLWAHEATATRTQDAEFARLLSEGETLALDGPSPQRWSVLHTPGHAPGHVCLHEAASGALVVGDMVASEGTILIAPGDGDMAEYLRQLRRLEGLAGSVALPAHGAPIAEPSVLFARYVAHRLGREARVAAALVQAGGGSLGELLPVAYADTPVALHPLAKMSLEAHLDKLVGDGRATRVGERYEPVTA